MDGPPLWSHPLGPICAWGKHIAAGRFNFLLEPNKKLKCVSLLRAWVGADGRLSAIGGQNWSAYDSPRSECSPLNAPFKV